MTSDQEAHLQHIKMKFFDLVDIKYRAGQLEHGGNLWSNSEVSLVENAILEAIDQIVYLITLRDKLVNNKLVK